MSKLMATQAESMARAFRRFASIADMLDYLADQAGCTGPEIAVYGIAARSIRDALDDQTPQCLTSQFCKERGL